MSGCCSEPEHNPHCPVPTHRLRNGRLNQTAYSLFLFMRDVAAGDFVGWLQDLIGELTASTATTPAQLQQRLVEPMKGVYGVSDKVLTMTLSALLFSAKARPAWVSLGGHLLVIDSLIHNYLHRTGILSRCSAQHAYGPACYKAGGCADIVRAIATQLDARQFNRSYPAQFPRFIQHAIWRYCALDGLDICNGNQIDDVRECQNRSCGLYHACDRLRLTAS